MGYPKLINPLYSSLNQVDQDVSKLVYSGLVRIDNQQNIVPDLAESWQISNDQKKYLFVLRDNLYWHDGTPLKVEDVLFTFEAIKNPDFKSPLASNFSDVTVEIVDDKTIKFELQEPYTPFLENLTVGILPEHLWRDVNPGNALLADYNLKPIGSGPYKLESLSKDKLGNIKSYTLIANEDYYLKEPYIQEVIFKFYPDYNSGVEALSSRNVDGISYLPKEMRNNLRIRKDLNFHSLQLPQHTSLFFNEKNNPALEQIEVRKALAHALNKQQIVEEAIETEGEVIDAPILPGFIGYNPKIATYDYNLEKAKELLTEAGYEMPESTSTSYRIKDGEELAFIITTVNNSENSLAAQAIQKMWQEVGIKVNLNLIDSQSIKNQVIKNRDYEILLFGEIVGIDPDPYPFWHSSQTGENGLNLSNFVNKEADQVLEEARQITDPQKRHDKYVHFQNILNQYLPAIFLYTPKYIYPMSEQVKGFDTQNIVSPSDRFSNIINWYIKTKRALQ